MACKNTTIKEGTTCICSDVFTGTSKTSITIPASVTKIEANAFYAFNPFSQSSLTSVIFENTTGWTAGTTPLDSTELADPATAAEYLTTKTYGKCEWTRS